MNAFQAPYKAVLISLYESAVKNENTDLLSEVPYLSRGFGFHPEQKLLRLNRDYQSEGYE